MDTPGSASIGPKTLYALKDAAIWLRVTEQTVASYLRSGDLKGKKIGPKGKWHVPGSELIRLRKKWGYDEAPS